MAQAALVSAPPTAAAAVVDVRGFSKRYRRRLAVDGVDLRIDDGEIHGLIGPDGAGKSSLMKAIAGVLRFDDGSVRVFGTALSSERAAESVKDRIGFMPQGLGHNLYPDLSVEENIDFFARLRLVASGELAQRKRRWLELTRLDRFGARPALHLSGGMKQKLALICTLIHAPRLLLLDEPTTGVDPVSRRDFWALLAQLMTGGGMCALISTAYLDEASRFNRVTLMHAGKLLSQGAPAEIIARVPGSIVSLRAADQVAALHRLQLSFPQTEARGEQLRVFVPGAPAAAACERVAALLPPGDRAGLSAAAPGLEDAFVALLRSDGGGGEPPGRGLEAPARSRPFAERGNLIEAIHLSKRFGDFSAVDDVSFVVPAGRIFGLLGANGAGKTTVIKMLTGILVPTRGTGRVAGADLAHAGRALKEHIGYVSQAFSLYTELTAAENLRLYAGIYGLGSAQTRARLPWAVTTMGLESHQHERADALPIGLRQRLALGCALLHQPAVLFLDEPTAGMDAVGRRQLWDILFHLSRTLGVAILVSTHYMSEAEHCDALGLMYSGRLIACAPPGQLRADLARELGHAVSMDDVFVARITTIERAAGAGTPA